MRLVLGALLTTTVLSTKSVNALEYQTPTCNVDLNSCSNSSGTPLSSLIATAADNNTTVVVPCNSCAYVDINDGSTIDLPNGIDIVGRLMFPPTANLEIKTTYIIIQGMLDIPKLNAGNKVTVNMYGSEDVYYYPHEDCNGSYDPSCAHRKNVGMKPIVVAGGKMNIEAVDSTCPSWTKLKYKAGDDKLMLDTEFASCLKVGDELLVTSSTTSWQDDKQSKITAIEHFSHGSVVTLDTPITESLPGADGTIIPPCQKGVLDGSSTTCCASSCGSCGGSGCSSRPGGAWNCCTGKIRDSGKMCSDPFQSSCTIDEGSEMMVEDEGYAVEVASLSRDVVFTADGGDHIGGHFIVFHTSAEQMISGVRFDNFGQGGILGRYPIHFHMCSSSTGSIVSKNVITNSNQRCVFIHDTHDVLIEDNVAYNTKGHCYATETGNERNNRFISNLGARTRKLDFSNGQSDSPGFRPPHHIAATFWVRSMMNEWIGNVAAGSQSQGFWFEMKDKKSNQLSETSFRDNVAHSNQDLGLTTYQPGWAPENGGHLLNMKLYKNYGDGMKLHATKYVTIENAIFADNSYSLRYGAFNKPITLKNSRIDALSNDYRYRLNGGSKTPYTQRGIHASTNNGINYDTPDSLKISNVTFSNFQGGRTIEFYYDDRMSYNSRGYGDPMNITQVKFVNSLEESRPIFSCGQIHKDSYLEDVEGVLGPDEYGPGFIVAGSERMMAFLPEENCHFITYSGSRSWQPDGCSYFCEQVCLRSVEIEPKGNSFISKMILENEDGVSYEMPFNGRNMVTEKIFFVVLPAGQYTSKFYDEGGNEAIPTSVNVGAHTKPKCTSYVTEDSLSFPQVVAKVNTNYEAETYTSASGGMSIKTVPSGYSGTGFVDYGGEGTWAEYTEIDGGMGGVCSITTNYALGSGTRVCSVTVNGVLQGDQLTYPSTGAWTKWEDSNTIQVSCTPGNTNTIRLTAGPNTAGPNMNNITIGSPSVGN